MNRILCSTGALIGRPNGRNYRLLTQCIRELECDGFEFLMYSTWRDEIEEMKSFLCSLSVDFPVFHIEKSVGNLISRDNEGDVEQAISMFETNCAIARGIGSEKLVLHLWGGIDSDKNIKNNFECYKTLKSIADGYGLALTVENVVCNQRDPHTHLKELVELYPDVRFTYDTKMAEFHSQSALIYLPESNDVFERISHLHINDYSGGYMDWSNLKTIGIGEGQVDFARLFGFLRQKGYSGDFTVEATSFGEDGVIDFARLNRCFSRIREYIK
ncbi:MAG: sugar phosphate isomerase/epimerase [Clostridia bacterium]|nr:sugar phosphate isomerase/epimerase [Clostridia bacterium]